MRFFNETYAKTALAIKNGVCYNELAKQIEYYSPSKVCIFISMVKIQPLFDMLCLENVKDLFGDNRSCVFRAQLRLRIFYFLLQSLSLKNRRN